MQDLKYYDDKHNFHLQFCKPSAGLHWPNWSTWAMRTMSNSYMKVVYLLVELNQCMYPCNKAWYIEMCLLNVMHDTTNNIRKLHVTMNKTLTQNLVQQQK